MIYRQYYLKVGEILRAPQQDCYMIKSSAKAIKITIGIRSYWFFGKMSRYLIQFCPTKHLTRIMTDSKSYGFG